METIFLKLGGSLITDKTKVERVRHDVLTRLVEEVAQARRDHPALRLVLGQGSGSFGHVAAARHGTRQGVSCVVIAEDEQGMQRDYWYTVARDAQALASDFWLPRFED